MYTINRLGLSADSVLLLATSSAALAQGAAQPATGSETQGEAIIVTGLRGQLRSITDSPVPIDVYSMETIEQSAQTDTLNVLQTLVPSYTVPRSANTTSNSFIRSPSLRGLSADKTLLLLNGHRRHKSGSVNVGGTGSQAADAAVIPSIALQSVEVLRDGAAAQYGSDAIAGVINFQLKNASHGGSLSIQGGRYYAGDGNSVQISGNIGLPLTDRGFVNISAQLNDDGRTVRARKFASTSWNPDEAYATDPAFRAAVDAAGLDLDKPLEKQGKPSERAARFIINSGIDLTDDSSLYAFANYSRSKGVANATYRVPGGKHAVMDNPIRLDDGSVWRFKDQYPLGLAPQFAGEVTDWSVTAGWRTEREFGNGQTFRADLSGRYGWDRILYTMWDTVNPSMGPDSPSFFRASDYTSDETSVNADFVYTIPVEAFDGPLTFNFGAEYRREGFAIGAGGADSYSGGTWSVAAPFGFCSTESNFSLRPLPPGAPTGQGINCTSRTDPVYNILQPGSNGITGLPPSVAGRHVTDSKSLYGEVTVDVTKALFFDLASRFEHYQSFGNKLVWKAAGRYYLVDWLALRGSIGTGFRAPTAGQLHMTQTQINTVGGVPLNIGLYPASNPVSLYLGAKPLGPEKSKNYSLGLTITPSSDMSVTIDAYQIKLTDQIYATTLIDVTPAIEAAMTVAGIAGASSIDQVNYFQNALDTTVRGIDFVASYRLHWGGDSPTNLTAAFNYNESRIDRINVANVSFNNVSRYNFSNNSPKWRGNVAAQQTIGPVTMLTRVNIFGPYSRQTTRAGNAIQRFRTQAMLDLEASASLGGGYSLAIGARNILGHYPAVNRIDDTNGRTYTDGPVDWQGGYYYGKITFSF